MIFTVWLFAIVYPLSGIFPWSNMIDLKGSRLTIAVNKYVCANYNRSFYVASFLGIYVVPLAIMTFTYCMILQIALSQIRAIEKTQVSLQSLDRESRNSTTSFTNDSINDTPVRMRREHKKKRMKRKELHATKSVAIVYTAFLVCWSPVCIVNIILLYDVAYFPHLLNTNKALFLFVWYVLIQILPMVNTMINPIIYSFSNKHFRKGFKSVFRRFADYYERHELNSLSQRTSCGQNFIDDDQDEHINQLEDRIEHRDAPNEEHCDGRRDNFAYQTHSIRRNVLWKPD